MGSRTLHIYDINSQCSERIKQIHQLLNPTSIVFCVDLSQYDEVHTEQPNQNKVSQSLLLFNSVVKSRWFARTSTLLLLCNIGRFGEKLRSKPLSDYFPSYNGGNDFSKASSYILRQFNRAYPSSSYLYSRFCEPSDVSNMSVIWSTVTKTMHSNVLKDSGFV